MRIVLSGYYGFGNVGDEAVLQAILNELTSRVPDAEICVLSAAPQLTAELNRVRAIPRYSLFRIIRELRQADIFVSGGGTLFQDATSRRSFLYYLGLVWLAKRLGRRVVILAQGFGPLRGRLNRLLARVVLNRVDLITLRDDESRQELERLGVGRPEIVVTADPTLLDTVPPLVEGRKVLALEGVPAGVPLVGLALRGLKGQSELENRLAQEIAAELNRSPRRQPVFLLFQCPEDMGMARKVIDRLTVPYHVIYRLCRPEEMLAMFPHFDLVVAMRLHAVIFATLAKVNCLALSYDPKVSSFARLVEQPCVEVSAGAEFPDRLAELLLRPLDRRLELELHCRRLCDQARRSFDLMLEKGYHLDRGGAKR
ncbi:MAG: polysaccharide pyruvyl transferase CsaB [Candidatus Margulisiibacteriota bacterium]